MPETQARRRDYKSTLNLPRTDFPMRADLPKREPDRIAWWAERGTYAKRLAKNAGNPSFILHDGPPYANGDLHMGHFLNRVLKDAFVKINLLDGKYADFVPGWDMHGLPIELETLKHLKLDFHHVDPLELREKCRERALYWLDRQREAILRMGVLGHYDDPYMTIAPRFEGAIVDVLADLADAKQLYKGLRATLWCVHDETALAEAEIEYHDHTSDSIYVRFPATAAQRADIAKRFGVTDEDVPLSIAIWTTTPWTLPANVAIALKPDAEYALYRVGNEDVRRRGSARRAAHRADQRRAQRRAARHHRGRQTRRRERAPSVHRPRFGRRHGRLRGTGNGNGRRAHRSRSRYRRLHHRRQKHGLPVLNPVDGAGTFTADAGPYAGQFIFKAQKQIIEDLRASGRLIAAESYEHSYPHCWRCKNPVVFRATAQWFIAMDANDCAAASSRSCRRSRSRPAGVKNA